MDFLEALKSTKTDEVEPPKEMPIGTYVWTVSKVPSATVTKSGEWSIVEFPIKCVSAMDDVDEDDLAEFGAVSGVTSRISFMAPTDPDRKNEAERAIYNIEQFLTKVLQIDTEAGESLHETMGKAINHQFLGQATYRADPNDAEKRYLEVKQWAPLD